MLNKIKIALIEPKIALALKKNKSVRVSYKNCEDKVMVAKIKKYENGILHLNKLGSELRSTARIENIKSFDIVKSFTFYKRKIKRFLQNEMYQEAFDVAFKELNQFHLPEQQKYLQGICDLCKKELFNKARNVERL